MKYKITLNNRVYEVEVEAGKAMLLDEYEALAPAAAAPAAAPAAPVAAPAPEAPAAAPVAAPVAAGADAVTSPMPGTILKVCVQNGQKVAEGDVLVILEAMKMENEILAPKAGTITQVAVTKGASVDTGAPLVVIG